MLWASFARNLAQRSPWRLSRSYSPWGVWDDVDVVGRRPGTSPCRSPRRAWGRCGHRFRACRAEACCGNVVGVCRGPRRARRAAHTGICPEPAVPTICSFLQCKSMNYLTRSISHPNTFVVSNDAIPYDSYAVLDMSATVDSIQNDAFAVPHASAVSVASVPSDACVMLDAFTAVSIATIPRRARRSTCP